MSRLRVALVQARPPATQAEALAVGLDHCRAAAAGKADIVLFPELWNVGYHLPESEADIGPWKAGAIAADSPFVAAFRYEAQELGIALALTFLEAHEPLPRNSFLLIDRHGRDVLGYAKVHTCAFGAERWCNPGEGFRVGTLDTAAGPVQVGAMICFDREFPESARVLAVKGAELILVPNACDIERNRTIQLETRAFENMVGIAMANYTSGPGNGHSLAFSGIAFAWDPATRTARSFDHMLVDGGMAEGILWADFDLAALRSYRASEVWGTAWRRPATYGPLLEDPPSH